MKKAKKEAELRLASVNKSKYKRYAQVWLQQITI
jgi:hypothetical protein